MFEWHELALCRGVDPELFFPGRGVNARNEKGDIAEAKALCAQCPVRLPCRDWGLRHEHLGVWGGLTENERRWIRRRDGIVCRVPELKPLSRSDSNGAVRQRALRARKAASA
jgi:WhiB family transcriptional regulator, redox-sensing transcriptional regulator